MNEYSILHPLRIGSVPYLNARPLVHCYDGPLQLQHPSGLARELADGKLDIALVPIPEVLRQPGFSIVDGVSISSEGPVFSVFLAYNGELKDVKRVALDPASLSSVNLLRALLAEYHGLTPEYLPLDGSTAPGIPRLLIGSQAIEFRRQFGPAFRYLDLGEEWHERTELPFVFAVWLMRPEVTNARAAADALRKLKKDGIARIGDIAGADKTDPLFAARYLSDCIRYELGDREKEAIRKFAALCAKHKLLPDSEPKLRFV